MNVQDDIGYVIETGENYIVRSKITKDGVLHVAVHHREGDKELLPRGYWLGGNMLSFDLRKKGA